MSESNGFEPRIVAYVCNWCTYLGADLAGTNRLEYPSNVRIIRLPCTGRIDFNLIVKAFEVGADAVLVSGCHPGDCHYTAGNYHARRRWILFRELLNTLGFDMNRIHFTWISAAEGKKFQEVITEITEKTRALGKYEQYRAGDSGAPAPRPAAQNGSAHRLPLAEALANVDAEVFIGYGAKHPVITKDRNELEFNEHSFTNLTAYLKRKEIKELGKPAVVVKGCDERALVVLERESQIDRKNLHVVGVACNGLGQAKCESCDVRQPRFADTVAGQADPAPAKAHSRYAELEAFMQKSPAERMAYWVSEFDRCVKCYACRQVCPMCYCERCVADKNRPTVIDTSATIKGNFAWHITRAFHLAGRCVGCDECTRVCPASINLRLLNLSLAKAAEERFGYRAGMDPNVDPVIGTYSLQDKENFIG